MSKEIDFSQFAPPGEVDFDAFDKPEDKPWTSDLAEVGKQAVAGLAVEVPKQVGQAMKWTSEPGKPVYQAGQSVTDWAAKQDEGWAKPDMEGRGPVASTLIESARQVAPSLATAGAVTGLAAAAPVVGLPALGAGAVTGLGAAATGAMFGMSQAQDTYERVKAAGGSDEEARKAGWASGLIEGAGESVANLAEMKLLGAGGKAIAGKMLETETLKPFAKQYLQTLGTEMATEAGQSGGEAAVEKAYGVDTNPLAEAGHGARVAAGMTTLLAPFGLGAHAAQAQGNKARIANEGPGGPGFVGPPIPPTALAPSPTEIPPLAGQAPSQGVQATEPVAEQQAEAAQPTTAPVAPQVGMQFTHPQRPETFTVSRVDPKTGSTILEYSDGKKTKTLPVNNLFGQGFVPVPTAEELAQELPPPPNVNPETGEILEPEVLPRSQQTGLALQKKSEPVAPPPPQPNSPLSNAINSAPEAVAHMQQQKAEQSALEQAAQQPKTLGEKKAQLQAAQAEEAPQPAITPAAQSLLDTVEQGGVPAFMTLGMRKIANENGIEVGGDTTPNDVIGALRDKVNAQEKQTQEAMPRADEQAASASMVAPGYEEEQANITTQPAPLAESARGAASEAVGGAGVETEAANERLSGQIPISEVQRPALADSREVENPKGAAQVAEQATEAGEEVQSAPVAGTVEPNESPTKPKDTSNRVQSIIPIAISWGPNRLRGKGEGAMFRETPEIGDSHAVVQKVLSEEARAQGVEPTQDWMRTSLSTILRMYENGLNAWRQEKGNTQGFMYDMSLPSGRTLRLGDVRLITRKYEQSQDSNTQEPQQSTTQPQEPATHGIETIPVSQERPEANAQQAEAETVNAYATNADEEGQRQGQGLLEGAIATTPEAREAEQPSAPASNWFLDKEYTEIAGATQAHDDTYYDSQNAHGPAGGPKVTTLTKSGEERAYEIASQGRLPLKSRHIDALTQVAGAGDVGVDLRQLPREAYNAIKDIEGATLGGSDARQRMLAADMRGDAEEGSRLRNENNLIRVVHDPDHPTPTAYITSAGRALIASARGVSDAMIAARDRAKGSPEKVERAQQASPTTEAPPYRFEDAPKNTFHIIGNADEAQSRLKAAGLPEGTRVDDNTVRLNQLMRERVEGALAAQEPTPVDAAEPAYPNQAQTYPERAEAAAPVLPDWIPDSHKPYVANALADSETHDFEGFARRVKQQLANTNTSLTGERLRDLRSAWDSRVVASKAQETQSALHPATQRLQDALRTRGTEPDTAPVPSMEELLGPTQASETAKAPAEEVQASPLGGKRAQMRAERAQATEAPVGATPSWVADNHKPFLLDQVRNAQNEESFMKQASLLLTKKRIDEGSEKGGLSDAQRADLRGMWENRNRGNGDAGGGVAAARPRPEDFASAAEYHTAALAWKRAQQSQGAQPAQSVDGEMNEHRKRTKADYYARIEPALREYVDAFNAMGIDRLERNRIKPEGMSAADWLEEFATRKTQWDHGRRIGGTGMQALSQKDLWPTDDGKGERLRKAMLNALKARRAGTWNAEWVSSVEAGRDPFAPAAPTQIDTAAQEPATSPANPVAETGEAQKSQWPEQIQNPQTRDDRLARRKYRALELTQARVDRLRGEADRLGEASKQVPGAFETGRSGYTLGKKRDAMNNRLSSNFAELQKNEQRLQELNTWRAAYEAGEVHANGQPKTNAPSRQAEQSAADLYADYIRAKVKKGDVVTFVPNPRNGARKVTRLSGKSVTLDSGTRWSYQDIAPMKGGRDMTPDELKEDIRAWRQERDAAQMPQPIEQPTEAQPNAVEIPSSEEVHADSLTRPGVREEGGNPAVGSAGVLRSGQEAGGQAAPVEEAGEIEQKRTKEPREMTKADWDAAHLAASKAETQALKSLGGSPRQKSFAWGTHERIRLENGAKAATKTPRNFPAITHQAVIEKALSEGKPVPAEALADYPDLAARPRQEEGLADYFEQSAAIKAEQDATEDTIGWGAATQEQREAMIVNAGWTAGKDNHISQTGRKMARRSWAETPGLIRQKIIQKQARQPAPPSAETVAPSPTARTINTLEAHKSAIADLEEGRATPESLRADYESFTANRGAIEAELNKLKKPELLKRAWGASSGDNKSSLVQRVLSGMEQQYVPSDGLQYDPFKKNGREEAIRKALDSATPESLAAYAEKVSQRRTETMERTKSMLKAVQNPETLDEFKQFIQYRKGGKEALTAEQRDRYEELVAAEGKAKAQKERAATATVGGVKANTESEIIETTHTKKGHALFVVRLADRVERDVYNSLNAAAKKLGGYYSSFRGPGAVPGFQFKSRAEAEQFQAILRGESVDRSAAVEEKVQQSQSKAAERLRGLADKLEEKANEALGRERLTNTARRARMANSADDAARKDVALAKTMRNIAEAMQSGEVKLLDGIRHRVDVEYLNSLVNQAKYAEIRQTSKDSWESDKRKGEPATAETARYAEYPVYVLPGNQADSVISALEEQKGGTRLAQKVTAFQRHTQGSTRPVMDTDLAEAIIDKVGGAKVPWYWRDTRQERASLAHLGITSTEQLRSALREFIQYRSERPKADRATELERAMAGNGRNVGVDFFPTPKSVAADMVERAGVREGMRVLEPSAGNGNIAEALRDAGAQVDVVEVSPTLREILEAKKFNLVGRDFMDLKDGGYDAIVMNPPFSNNQDIQHVQHAYSLLKPGGRLVAIVGEGAFFRTGKTEVAFREWLDEVGATVEKLPEGTFQDKTLLSTTGVNARLVEIEKPSGEEVLGGEAETRPAPITTPERQQSRQSAQADRAVDSSKDSLLAAIAKRGGVSMEEARRQGIDPAYFGVRGHKIYRVFTKNGMTFDDMAHNMLGPDGYPVTGANDLLEAIEKELAGQKVRTPEGDMQAMEREYAGAEDPHGDPGFMLDESEYHSDADAYGRRIEELSALADRMQEGAGEAIVERAAIQETSDEETIRQLEQWIADKNRAGVDQGKQGARAQAGVQEDAFGRNETAQAVHEARLAKDVKRNGGNGEFVEAGALGGLWSGEEKQADVEDLTGKGPAITEQGANYEARETDSSDLSSAEGRDVERATERAGSEEARGDLHPASGVQLSSKVVQTQTGQLTTGFPKVTTWGEAAHTAAQLRKFPQEHFLALVLDQDSKPIAALRHTVGTEKQSPVAPSLIAGSIYAVPDAKEVIFAHNHPSGSAALSNADITMTDALAELMRGTGVEVRGMIAVARDKFAVRDTRTPVAERHNQADQSITPARRQSTIPILERIYRKQGRLLDHAITSPESAMDAARALLGNNTGVLLMDNAHYPLGVVPLSADEAVTLRGEGGPATRILRAVHESNASAAIMVINNQMQWDAARNVGTLMHQAGVRFNDIINPQRGSQESLASMRTDLRNIGAYFSHSYAATIGERTHETHHPATLRFALQRALRPLGRGLYDNLMAQPWFHIVTSEDMPGVPAEAKNSGMHGYYNPKTHQAYLVANNIEAITSDEDLRGLVLHEIGVHAMQLGRGTDEFKAILKAFDDMAMSGDKAAGDAFMRAMQVGTPSKSLQEEALAYFIEAHPDLSFTKRVVAWFRQVLRDLGEGVGLIPKRWAAWANTLSHEDLVYMAQSALRRSVAKPSMGVLAPFAVVQYAGGKLGEWAMRGGGEVKLPPGEFLPPIPADGKGIHDVLFSADIDRQASEVIPIRDSEGRLLAPNGKPSRLNEMQWRQVRTPEFKAWFGPWDTDPENASKVVDENGEPLIEYHGTNSEFTVFDVSKTGSNTDDGWAGKGFYFHEDPTTSALYGRNNMPVFLRLINPYDFTGQNFSKVVKEYGGPAAFSEWLKQHNYDGAILWGQRMVLSPTQIKSAIGNTGAFDPENADIRYSKGTPTEQAVEDWKSYGRPAGPWLGVFTRDMIVDMYKDDMPELKTYQRHSKAWEAIRNKHAIKADRYVKHWKKTLTAAEQDALSDVALEATIQQYDPDRLRPENEEQALLKQQFDALPDKTKAVYREVRDMYKARLLEVRNALVQRVQETVEDAGIQQELVDRIMNDFADIELKGPYFPLPRFGRYVVIGRVLDNEGKENISAREVQNYESEKEARSAAKTLRDGGYTVQMTTKDQYDRNSEQSKAVAKIVRTARDAIDAAKGESQIDAETLDQMEDTIRQTLIEALPDLSYRKSFTHRKNRRGFSKDMQRAFAERMYRSSNLLASLQTQHKIQQAINAMQTDIKGNISQDVSALHDVVNEIVKREQALAVYRPNAFAQLAQGIGFNMALGANMASATINLLQTPLVAIPYNAARYGLGKTLKEFSRAAALLQHRNLYSVDGFDLEKFEGLSEREREMVLKLRDSGQLNYTLTHDLIDAAYPPGADTGIAGKASQKMQTLGKWSALPFHIGETMNREVTALATYRLAFADAKSKGMDEDTAHQTAIQAASDANDATHFDYQQQNRSRLMMGNTARVLTQFKQYSLNMAYLIGRNAYQSVKGKTREERLVAAKTLGYMMGGAFATAGLMGLPISYEAAAIAGGVAGFQKGGQIGAAAGAITGLMLANALVAGIEGDDDDFAQMLRQGFAEAFGVKGGEAITRGPMRMIPWLGDIDLASRTSMNQMFVRPPDRELEGADLFHQWTETLLGPFVGQIGNWFDAKKLFDDGHPERAMETIMPNVLKSAMRAGRYATEGAKTMKEEPLLERELTPWEYMVQFMGFTPSRLAERQQANTAVKNAEVRLDRMRERLINERIDAIGDEIPKVQAKIQRFNSEHPTHAINGRSLAQSRRARALASRQTEGGLRLSRKHAALRDLGDWADTE